LTRDTSPRAAVIGDNINTGLGERVSDQMARDYAADAQSVDDLVQRAGALPIIITTDEESLQTGVVIKAMRDKATEMEAKRRAEGDPYLRAKQACDGWFFPLIDRLCSRRLGDKPGIADILQDRVDAHLARKRAVEEARRRAEADKAAKEAAEAAREAAKRAREAELAARAALRAKEAEEQAQAAAQAVSAGEAATEARVAARTAMDKAEEARIATLAKPADMSRTRGEGVLLTEARKPYVIVTDRTKLDKEVLWPFFSGTEIEKAVKAWARTTGHNQKMAGAEIGHRMTGVTR
jgi:dTMP kinase